MLHKCRSKHLIALIDTIIMMDNSVESLGDRTLRIFNFNGDLISKDILQELFLQAGPIVNVVHRSDHAFIEYTTESSVAYALALFQGIRIYGDPLQMEPKNPNPKTFRYVNVMRDFEKLRDANPQLLEEESHKSKRFAETPKQYNHNHYDRPDMRHHSGHYDDYAKRRYERDYRTESTPILNRHYYRESRDYREPEVYRRNDIRYAPPQHHSSYVGYHRDSHRHDLYPKYSRSHSWSDTHVNHHN